LISEETRLKRLAPTIFALRCVDSEQPNACTVDLERVAIDDAGLPNATEAALVEAAIVAVTSLRISLANSQRRTSGTWSLVVAY
jgi:hypothetical protein